MALQGGLQKLLTGDLRAHVEGVHLRVALETVVSGEALHVHDRVDAYGVRVALDGGAHDSQLAPQLVLDECVDGVVVHFLDLEVVALHLVGVDAGVGAAVSDEEGEAGVDGLALGYAYVVEAELLDVLLADVGRLHRVHQGQRERQLDDAVIASVTVRSDIHQCPPSAAAALSPGGGPTGAPLSRPRRNSLKNGLK